MRLRAALLLLASLVVASCVEPESSLAAFCTNRPEACDAGALPPPCPASDEFDGPSLSECFQQYPRVVPATSLPAAVSGALVLDQQPSEWWWSNGRVGGFVSQEVTGAFVVEVRATARQLDGGVQFRSGYVGAAIVAADPARLDDSRLISVGALGALADGGIPLGVLVQVSEDAGSAFLTREEGFSTGGTTLRLCRNASGDWSAFYLPNGTPPWVRFSFAPSTLVLPDRVAVGPGSYQVGGAEWHRMTFDYFRIRRTGRDGGGPVADDLDCVQPFDGGR